MAQDILITPGTNPEPSIEFRGSGTNTSAIYLNVYGSGFESASNTGSALIFEGDEGTLLSINDNLSSGVIFTVNDIAGDILISASASGDVRLAEDGRYVGIGTGLPSRVLDVYSSDTGTILQVHGTGAEALFAIDYTGVDTPTTVSIYNNDGQTEKVFQVLSEQGDEFFTVSPTGKIYYNSSYSQLANSGNIGSSITFDLDTSNIFSGTLTTTSITLSTTNGNIGQRFMLRLKQDGTGGRTVGTWFGSRVSWPGGSAPTLSSSANLVDLFGFLVTSGTSPNYFYDGFTIATGLQR